MKLTFSEKTEKKVVFDLFYDAIKQIYSDRFFRTNRRLRRWWQEDFGAGEKERQLTEFISPIFSEINDEGILCKSFTEMVDNLISALGNESKIRLNIYLNIVWAFDFFLFTTCGFPGTNLVYLRPWELWTDHVPLPWDEQSDSFVIVLSAIFSLDAETLYNEMAEKLTVMETLKKIENEIKKPSDILDMPYEKASQTLISTLKKQFEKYGLQMGDNEQKASLFLFANFFRLRRLSVLGKN